MLESALHMRIYQDVSRENMVCWNTRQKRRNGSATLGKSGEQKYMQMAAYLFELGYDLALAKIDNVSESPGFEGCGLRKID